jgi:hypothetical protein
MITCIATISLDKFQLGRVVLALLKNKNDENKFYAIEIMDKRK